MNRKLLVFHHSDLDGMGVKLLGMLYGDMNGLSPEEIETFKCNYGDVDDIILERLKEAQEKKETLIEILIGDISIQKQETAEILDNLNKSTPVNLLDHHSTATWLNKYSWAKVREVDENLVLRCGTYWVYDFIVNQFPQGFKMREEKTFMDFVTLVDLYDTWKWMSDPENPTVEAENLNSVFKMLGEKKFTQLMYQSIIEDTGVFNETASLVVDLRNGILDSRAKRLEKDMKKFKLNFDTYRDKDILKSLKEFYEEHYRDNQERLEFAAKNFGHRYTESFKVGVVFETDNISDLGNRLLANHPELDFIIFVALPGLISYRSKRELNVPLGIMAKYITGYGGGHPCSSGGSFSHKVTYDVINKLIPCLGGQIDGN